MTFDEFSFDENLNKALIDLNFEIPTQIQEESIFKILEGNDLLGIAKTGTGKTVAFSLPILDMMIKNKKECKVGHPRFVIIAPTRELVAQIGNNIRSYSKYTFFNVEYFYGGVKLETQLETLLKKIDILIATPKRLADLIKQKLVNLSDLDYFVIDEADKVIQISSSLDLKYIISRLPSKRQSLFFSATFDENLEKLSNELLKKAIRIRIENKIINILEKVLYVKKENKEKLLLQLLNKKEVRKAIIFTNTKKVADDLIRFLTENKIKSECLHSSKSNTHRTKVINHMRSSETKYLIATDLAARGLDIEGITHIINYEVPLKVTDYIHRIGRTARAENEGTALTLCSIEERELFRSIENNRNIEIMTHAYHSDVAKKTTAKDLKKAVKIVKYRPKPKKNRRSNYSNRKGKK